MKLGQISSRPPDVMILSISFQCLQENITQRLLRVHKGARPQGKAAKLTELKSSEIQRGTNIPRWLLFCEGSYKDYIYGNKGKESWALTGLRSENINMVKKWPRWTPSTGTHQLQPATKFENALAESAVLKCLRVTEIECGYTMER